MKQKGYYVGREKTLLRKLDKTLLRWKRKLDRVYGVALFPAVRESTIRHFTELIPGIPWYRAASYQEIILVNAQLIAIIRAMNDAGVSLEATLRIQTELFREEFRKIPRIAGRLFVSPVGKFFLKKLARKVTNEGWDTEVVEGGRGDDFDVSVITRRCGVEEYLRAEGMEELLRYCNMSDFLMFPGMNIGLRQTSTIKNGSCVYCMKHGGITEVPDSLKVIYK